MAGSSVTITRTSRDISNIRKAEVNIALALLSDDTNGLVPSQEMAGLQDYYLHSVQPVPDATAPATSAFEICIQDEAGADIFLSGSVAVDSVAPITGSVSLGWYPMVWGTWTFKLVDPSDHTSTIDIGNEKEMVVNLRFGKKIP